MRAPNTSRAFVRDDLFMLEYNEIYFVKVIQKRRIMSKDKFGVFILEYFYKCVVWIKQVNYMGIRVDKRDGHITY